MWHGNCAVSVFFHKNSRVGLKEVETEQVRQVLQASIGLAFCAQKDERLHHIFHDLFVNNGLSVGYVTEVSFVQKLLKLRGRERSALAQEMSHPSPFKMELHFQALIFLEDYLRNNLMSAIHNCNSAIVYACGIRCSFGDDGLECMYVSSWTREHPKCTAVICTSQYPENHVHDCY